MAVPISTTQRTQASPSKGTGLKVEITCTTPIYPSKLFIQWLLRNPPVGNTFTFNIYRSGSSNGPWEKVADEIETYFYIDEDFSANYADRTPGLITLNSTVYYKIAAVQNHVEVAEIIDNISSPLDARRRGIRRKLLRDSEILLRKITGTPMAVLKKRQWGEPCPSCVTSTGQSARAHCGTCYGTGIKYGYWAPVYGFAQRSASPVQTQTDTGGLVEINRMSVIMWNIPKVETRDMIAFLDGQRYIIEVVNPTQIHFVSVHQECSVSELAKGASEQNIIVDPWHEPPWM